MGVQLVAQSGVAWSPIYCVSASGTSSKASARQLSDAPQPIRTTWCASACRRRQGVALAAGDAGETANAILEMPACFNVSSTSIT
jgi:hypothetical protein